MSGLRDQRALAPVVVIGLGMAARDLWLAAQGGGITPRWLLALETVAFGSVAVAAAAGLAAPRGQDHRRSSAARVATIAGGVATTTHVIRLWIYLRRRPR